MAPTIVLLFPRAEPDYPDETKLLGLPLAVLTVARPLHAAGYDVRIVDENVTPRVIDELRRIPRPLYVGISCLGGGQIPSGLALARQVRRLWPGAPKVWGGWNPTLLPHLYEHDSVRDEVDVIVRGRGEAPALELARRLERGDGLEDLPGVSWRDRDGTMRRNPDAPLDDPSEGGILPYELIERFDAYLTRHGILNFISSYGCPHRCAFCGIPARTQTFRPTDNARVVEQLAAVSRERGVHTIIFYDDNFFTRKQRVLDLAARMIDADLGLSWYSNGRVDQVSTFDHDELTTLVRSGCRGINVGYETGEQAVADGVQKDVVVRDVDEIAARFARVGLHLSLNFMVGLPGEDEASLVRSLETLHGIHAINPNLDVCWYMFMPAPGTPLWSRLVDEGRLTEPRTLQEHTGLQSMYLETPWYYESPRRSVFREWRQRHKAIAWTFFHAYAAPIPAGWPGRMLATWLRRWCRWRFERRRFGLPIDWWLLYRFNQLRVRLRWTRARALRARAFDRLRRRTDAGTGGPGDGPGEEPIPFPWIHGTT